MVGLCPAWWGVFRRGKAGEARHGMFGCCRVLQDETWLERLGSLCYVVERRGLAGMVRLVGLWRGRLMHGVFRFGWLGKLRLGVAWLVSESCGLAGVERLGRVRPVTVRCGLAGYKRRYNLWSTNGKMRHGLSPMPK